MNEKVFLNYKENLYLEKQIKSYIEAWEYIFQCLDIDFKDEKPIEMDDLRNPNSTIC